MVIMVNITNNGSGHQVDIIKPETFRLPKTGQRDPFFGLPRTTYYDLEKSGTIRLIRLRKRGNVQGITLVPFDAVLDYLHQVRKEAV